VVNFALHANRQWHILRRKALMVRPGCLYLSKINAWLLKYLCGEAGYRFMGSGEYFMNINDMRPNLEFFQSAVQ